MDGIKIEVSGNIAKVTQKPQRITAGTVGMPVEFTFDDQWGGLDRIAVFQAGRVRKNMALVENATAVPMEVLATPGPRLNIGVYGVNKDGSVAIPTLWANAGQIREGATPGDGAGSDIGIAKKYYDKAMLAAADAESAARRAVDAADSVSNQVSYKPQELTEEEKKQARNNIGAVSDDALVEQIDGIMEIFENYVSHHAPQDLTEEQKAQARENIGAAAVGEGGGASTYYHTTREKVGKKHTEAGWSEYIWGLYDTLMEKYPDNVKKEEFKSNDGTFTNYGYVISTGQYSLDGEIAEQWKGQEPDIKKPKYLIVSGYHGMERHAVISVYRFIRDVLNGQNVPPSFKEGVIISVLPIADPSGFDAFSYENFDCSDGTTSPKGQAVINWLKANEDADLLLDLHNGSALNENVAICGNSNYSAVEMAKKIAMKGVDRIIPYWKDVIKYHKKAEKIQHDADKKGYKVVEASVIFSYCVTATIGSKTPYGRATNVHSIPGLGIELFDYYCDKYSDYNPTYNKEDGTVTIPQPVETYPNDTPGSMEAIAAGAEAIGNILLEFYAQSVAGSALGDIESALAGIIAIQNSYIEGGAQ